MICELQIGKMPKNKGILGPRRDLSERVKNVEKVDKKSKPHK